MPTPVLPPDLTTALATQVRATIVSPVVADSKSITISSPSEYQAANDYLLRAARAKREVMEKFDAITKPMHTAWTAATGLRGEVIAPLDHAIKSIENAMVQFKSFEARQIAADRLKRKQEEEKLQLEVEEQERERRADELIAQGVTDDKVIAAVLEGREVEVGLEPTAEVIAVSTAAEPEPMPIKVRGSWTRTVYGWEVDDLKALVKAAAEGKVPVACLAINESFLNANVKNETARKLMADWSPFVRVTEELGISKRSR